MSGRIQQIQLLNREKRDANFEQVWSDLESEIQLNKFKTISQALFQASSQSKSLSAGSASSSLFTLLQSSSMTSSSPSLIKHKHKLVEESEHAVEWTVSSEPTLETSEMLLMENIPLEQSADDGNAFSDEEHLICNHLSNFKPSWFNVGLLRFAFVNLCEEAIGISVIVSDTTQL